VLARHPPRQLQWRFLPLTHPPPLPGPPQAAPTASGPPVFFHRTSFNSKFFPDCLSKEEGYCRPQYISVPLHDGQARARVGRGEPGERSQQQEERAQTRPGASPTCAQCSRSLNLLQAMLLSTYPRPPAPPHTHTQHPTTLPRPQAAHSLKPNIFAFDADEIDTASYAAECKGTAAGSASAGDAGGSADSTGSAPAHRKALAWRGQQQQQQQQQWAGWRRLRRRLQQQQPGSSGAAARVLLDGAADAGAGGAEGGAGEGAGTAASAGAGGAAGGGEVGGGLPPPPDAGCKAALGVGAARMPIPVMPVADFVGMERVLDASMAIFKEVRQQLGKA